MLDWLIIVNADARRDFVRVLLSLTMHKTVESRFDTFIKKRHLSSVVFYTAMTSEEEVQRLCRVFSSLKSAAGNSTYRMPKPLKLAMKETRSEEVLMTLYNMAGCKRYLKTDIIDKANSIRDNNSVNMFTKNSTKSEKELDANTCLLHATRLEELSDADEASHHKLLTRRALNKFALYKQKPGMWLGSRFINHSCPVTNNPNSPNASSKP